MEGNEILVWQLRPPSQLEDDLTDELTGRFFPGFFWCVLGYGNALRRIQGQQRGGQDNVV